MNFSDVVFNDIKLLRYGYKSITGKDIESVLGKDKDKDLFLEGKCVCFGSYGIDGNPRWVVTVYDFVAGHECKLDLAVRNSGVFSAQLFKKMAFMVFDYVFNQAKLKRCSVEIRESNKASIKLVTAWGFKQEGFKPLGFIEPEEARILFGMLRKDCKWIELRD
jgi:hypothetical protein